MFISVFIIENIFLLYTRFSHFTIQYLKSEVTVQNMSEYIFQKILALIPCPKV